MRSETQAVDEARGEIARRTPVVSALQAAMVMVAAASAVAARTPRRDLVVIRWSTDRLTRKPWSRLAQPPRPLERSAVYA
jgi:hypothetical protein